MSSFLNVHIRVNDAATNRPTPVRISIEGPKREYYPPLGHPIDFPSGKHEGLGLGVYAQGRKFAYIDGGCETPLPANMPLSVVVTKGPFYKPLETTITLKPGQMAVRLTIERWAPAALTSLDSRIHSLDPFTARAQEAAEDIELSNLLVQPVQIPSQDGKLYETFPGMAAFSGQHDAFGVSPNKIYVNSLNAHPVLGRLALWHCHRAVFPFTFGGHDQTDDWSLADWCDQCHRKKGFVVWVDAYRPELGMVGGEALIQAILGRIDAIEIDAVPRKQAFFPVYYRLLNAGIMLPLVGGSGKDNNRTALGAMRTCTQGLAEPRDLKAWMEAIAARQTFVTNGASLALLDGHGQPLRPGPVALGQPLELVAQAQQWGPFDQLDLVVNGVVVASAKPTGDSPRAAEVRYTHTPTQGAWVAARVVGLTSFAHTSPVVLEVEGTQLPRAEKALAQCRQEIEAVKDWVTSQGRFTLDKRRDYLLELAEQALTKLG